MLTDKSTTERANEQINKKFLEIAFIKKKYTVILKKYRCQWKASNARSVHFQKVVFIRELLMKSKYHPELTSNESAFRRIIGSIFSQIFISDLDRY